jgi:hypothetical protein
MKEIQNLRSQLSHLVSVVTKENITEPEKLSPPSADQVEPSAVKAYFSIALFLLSFLFLL